MGENRVVAGALSHEEIVKSFLGSKAVDFAALGKFVSEYGESIVSSGRGDYGVRFGHYNILACFNIGPRNFGPVDIGRSGLAQEISG